MVEFALTFFFNFLETTASTVLTHVLQRSRSGVLALQAEGVEALRASQVHNLDGVEVGHHDVVGLEVQVEDAAVVEVLDSLEDLDQVTHDVVLGVTEPFVSGWGKKKFSNVQTFSIFAAGPNGFPTGFYERPTMCVFNPFFERTRGFNLFLQFTF